MRVVVKHPGEAPVVEDIEELEDVLGDAHHEAWSGDQATFHAMDAAMEYNLLAPVEYRLPICGPVVAVPRGDHSAEMIRDTLERYCNACSQMTFAMS